MNYEKYDKEIVNLKDICKINIVTYNNIENGVTSISHPLIGIVDGDRCYDILNKKYYLLFNKEKKQNGIYAYIFSYPFKDMDEVINYDELLEIFRLHKSVENFRIFEKDRICGFKYKIGKEKISSIGYVSIRKDGDIYDLYRKQLIDDSNIYYRNIPFSKSNENISLNEINNILKLRKKR